MQQRLEAAGHLPTRPSSDNPAHVWAGARTSATARGVTRHVVLVGW
jgi:hypothetical protein